MPNKVRVDEDEGKPKNDLTNACKLYKIITRKV